jgi:UDP-glucose 4-epimerase
MSTTRSMVPAPRGGRRVAITGGDTALGRRLTDLLQDDARVARAVVVDVAAPRAGLDKTRHYRIDLVAPGAEARIAELLEAERIDTLVHLAFGSSPARDAARLRELETLGTRRLLDGAAEAPPAQLVMSSQTILYGAAADNPGAMDERCPLRAPEEEAFFAGKLDAERALRAFASRAPDTAVALLRTAPVLGPAANGFMSRYLRQRLPMTLLGFDPLWQLLHEVDAAHAFKLAIDRSIGGTFNIVGDGVLPLSQLLQRSGRRALPVPHPLARATIERMWSRQLFPWPPGFVPLLRYACLADGERAADELGFRAACTTEEALADFARRRGAR